MNACFLVEVMGRHSGYIALYTAIAAAAEIVCIPETPTEIGKIVEQLRELKSRGKSSVMMVVAEGDESGSADQVKEQLEAADCPFATRVVVLGHLQRGGSPTPEDRLLASRLGHLAVKSLLDGQTGVMAGIMDGKEVTTPFEQAFGDHKPIPPGLMDLLKALSQ